MKINNPSIQTWASPTYPDAVIRNFRDIENLISLRKYDLAVERARQALADEPGIPHLHFLLAYALWSLKKADEAKESALKAVRLDVHCDKAHNLLGVIALVECRFDAAKAYFEQALGINPFVAEYQARYGEVLSYLHDWSHAMTYYTQALQIDPNYGYAHLLRAKAFRQQSNFSAAEESILTALRINPEDPLAHELFGDNYFDRYRVSDAYASYRTALRINPMNDYVKRKLIDALKAKIPLLGEYWNAAYDRQHQTRRATINPTGTAVLLILFGLFPLCASIAFWGDTFQCLSMLLFSSIPLVTLLFLGGFLKQILYDFGDPIITYLVTRGWIKL